MQRERVWYNPWTWGRKAQSVIANANTAQSVIANANTKVLKTALRNYINAVNKLPNKNNAYIYGLMMKTANGANASYKNRIVNGIAQVVAASRRAIPQAAAAAAGATGAPSESVAAAAVNNVTAKIKNLNQRMTGIKNLAAVAGGPGGPTNSQVAASYISRGYNNLANRAINTTGKYTAIWAEINKIRTKSVNVPGRSNKANLGRIGPKGSWFFKNNSMNKNFKIVGASTNNPVIYRKNNASAPKQYGPQMMVPNKVRNPTKNNLNKISSITSIVKNASYNNKTKINTIRSRFPNVNYNNLSIKATNAEVKAILKNIANSAAAARTVAGAIGRIRSNNLEGVAGLYPSPEKISANKKAKIQTIVTKLWGLAGTGRASESPNAKLAALAAARADRELMNLMTNNISRSNFNSILNSTSYAPPSNATGNNRRRHTARVKNMLKELGWKAPTN